MSEERIAGDPDPAEEGRATAGEQRSNRCSEVSALCCCIPRRRVSLPGMRPKERKKKKNAGGISFSDIMLEEEMDQALWNISVGDRDSVQTEDIKPTLPLSPQAYVTKDHCIPLPIGTFYLEEKQKDYDEMSVVKPLYKKGKATRPSKEELDDQRVLCSEMENESVVGAVSEGPPCEKGTRYQVTPNKENSQARRPALLGISLQEADHEKEQQDGGNHASIISEAVSYKMAWGEQEQQAVSFQELQPSGKREDLRSPLPETEIKMQKGQNDTSTDHEGVTSLMERLIRSRIPRSEEQQSLQQQQLAQDIAHKVEEQVTWDKMKAVPEEDIQKKVQGPPNTPYKEVWQSVELKYPEILPILDKNHKQEESGMLPQVDLALEASHSEAEHNYRKMVDQEAQQPIIQKAVSCSFQDTAYEKEQEEIQGTTDSTSDSPLSKAGEHRWIPHQVNIQAVGQENKPAFPLVAACAMEQHNLDHTNVMPEDDLVHITSQKKLEKQHVLLAEHVRSTHHHRGSRAEELQEGLDPSNSVSQVTVLTEERENSGLLTSENMGTLPDNISYEKEQQRKLECGDSGSESLYDKEEQDRQPTLYLEGQLPLVLEQLSSVPSSGTSEAEECARKRGTLETHPLEEQQIEYGDRSPKLLSVPEKEAEDDQEDQEPTMFPSAQWNAQGEQTEAWHAPKDTFIPHEEQPQREQLDLGITCEEHQRNGRQSLSETRSSCSTKNNEENM